MFVSEKILPSLPAPDHSKGIVVWLRKNLFSSIFNTLLSLLALFLLVITLFPIINWAFFNADWIGQTRDDCTGSGACWIFIEARFGQFMYGYYPEALRWRPNLAGLILLALVVSLFLEKMPKKNWVGGFTLLLFPFIAYVLIYGGYFGLEIVETEKWGGLMLTLIISLVGITVALPLGIVLALGRRSDMPIIKSMSVVFIEFWRGVPLITVLFMSSVMLPLFLPEGSHFDKLLRAMIGIILFQSAYVAEVVRGGLQSIPKGQFEAAAAMGLNYWKTTLLIILPQALKKVIPSLVNTFIALFKDTTLVLIIGLLDLLAIIQQANADTNWLGFETEGYVFAALIFWIFCFGMSRYSVFLENKLHTGHKK